MHHKGLVISIQWHCYKFFLSMISFLKVVGKVSVGMPVLETNFYSANRMSTLLKVRKSIFRTTSRPILANKKVSEKNQIFPSLFLTDQFAITILKVSMWDLSIFCVSTLIFLAQKPNFIV